MSRRQTVRALIPRRRAGKDQLCRDADQREVPEAASKDGRRARCREEEEGGRGHDGEDKVAKAIGNPSHQVQNRVVVCGEDVGQVCTVEDVLERWQNLDPDMGTVLDRDEPETVSHRARKAMASWPDAR